MEKVIHYLQQQTSKIKKEIPGLCYIKRLVCYTMTLKLNVSCFIWKHRVCLSASALSMSCRDVWCIHHQSWRQEQQYKSWCICVLNRKLKVLYLYRHQMIITWRTSSHHTTASVRNTAVIQHHAHISAVVIGYLNTADSLLCNILS